MPLRTFERHVDTLRLGVAEVDSRPGLVYSTGELSQARSRIQAHPELVSDASQAADRTLSDPDLYELKTEPYYSIGPLGHLVAAYMVQPQQRYADGVLRLLRSFAQAPEWVAHVHSGRGMKCDHCSANTAAAMVLAMEAVAGVLTAEDEEFLTQAIYDRCLRFFLQTCQERSQAWAQREHRFNWRIMTCGEAGLAALGLRGLPDRMRMIEFALEGVSDILDRVPPEGDWEEGPGYLANTLFFGLRFALALRNATGGRIDLFQHPAMANVSDYFAHLTLPDGSIFNYADGHPTISPTPLFLLARETRSSTAAFVARRMGYHTIWDILFDDPEVRSEPPPDERRARVFPTSGIVVARSDWSDDASFVGFKSGPTLVGHSHLDIQSFVVSKGSAPLIVDSGIWPYAHFLGFFDTSGRRWDFDSNASIGHNTVLVDGQGQTHGGAGVLVASDVTERLTYVVSDARSLYPGLLDRFDRWLVFAPPDLLLVYDDIEASSPRHWEWLLHHAGTFSGDRMRHLIENKGVRLSLERLLPVADTPWRSSEEVRTSYYQDSNAQVDVERTIRLRRFGPLFPSERVEFLWAMQIGATEELVWELERRSESEFSVHVQGLERRVSLNFDRASYACSMTSGPGSRPASGLAGGDADHV